jgi:hypothetical protein
MSGAQRNHQLLRRDMMDIASLHPSCEWHVASRASSWPGKSAKRVFALDDPAIHVFLHVVQKDADDENAGRVERSETHQSRCGSAMGFASLYPSYGYEVQRVT